MNISQNELRRAAASSGLSTEQTDQLWHALKLHSVSDGKPQFDPTHVAYYLGALIVIGAMGWFMNKAWEGLGGAGLFAVAVSYLALFVLAGQRLWNKPGLRVPAGLLITIAVCMVPLATYGVERWTGFWPASDPGPYTRFHPYINGSWIIMELATVFAGLIALRLWRFPFITAPIAYALWYMSMDLTDLLYGNGLGWEEKKVVSTAFGAAVLIISYLADLRGKSGDYAFWGYLFGLMAFWGGLSSMNSDSEAGKLIYCLVNIVLIFLSLVLRRRMFLVFGALGLFGYLSHLAYSVFEDSLLFPIVLSLIGLATMYLGFQYQRHRTRIEQQFLAKVGPYIRRFVPPGALSS